jgi:hypothetical protein
MTESQVVNEWISQGEARGRLAGARQSVLHLLEHLFPGTVPEEIERLITREESLQRLDAWFEVALTLVSKPGFVAAPR